MPELLTVKIKDLNVCNDEYYKLNEVDSIFEPLVGFNYSPCKNYTTIMIDTDAIDDLNPFQTYLYLHMLKINNSIILNPYVPPAPYVAVNSSLDTKIHTYEFLLFEQTHEMKHLAFMTRANFNLKKFVKKHSLKLVGTLKFKTSKISP